MSRHVRFTSDCGVLPPGVVYIVWRTSFGAHALGDEAAGVALVPRQEVHDPDRVDGGEHLAAVGSAGVVGGAPGGLDDQVDGLERRRAFVDAVRQLPAADDDGRAGIEGHRRMRRMRIDRPVK